MLHQNLKTPAIHRLFIFAGALLALIRCRAQSQPQSPVLTGQAAFTDAAHEAPGIRRHLTVADLPDPAPDQSVDNGPNIVPRPARRLAHCAHRASRWSFTPPASTIRG